MKACIPELILIFIITYNTRGELIFLISHSQPDGFSKEIHPHSKKSKFSPRAPKFYSQKIYSPHKERPMRSEGTLLVG